MNELSDQQLLQDYAERQSEPAFAELLRRHIDFVYSAALRMVCDPHTAEDVTQNTFIALTKNARLVRNRSVLSSWLHSTARNLAANAVRTEVRRREREQEAAAMNELLANEPEAAWKNIAPYLDDAIAELADSDRDALLLRYFERKSAREMGQIFGTSEEAAQKRVSRAVERLRESFAKRGVAVGAGGLAVLISANAIQAAPLALPASISTAALTGATIHTSTTVTAAKIIAMTTLQKALVTLTIVTLAGANLYQARETSQLSDQIRTLQQQPAPLIAQIQQLQHDQNDTVDPIAAMAAENQSRSNSNTDELLKLRAEVGRLREANSQLSSVTNDSSATLVKSWLERRDKLKQLVEMYPDKSIPEFQMLSEEQWLDAAMNAKFDTEKETQRLLANLRRTAEDNLATQMHGALLKYLKDNNDKFPTDLSQLQSYFEAPINNAILERWGIVPAMAVPNVGVGDMVITRKTPIDPNLDNQWAIGKNGYGSSSYPPDLKSALATLDPAIKAFSAANNGQAPFDPSQIQPYLTTPEQEAAYQKLLTKSAGTQK